MPGYIVKAELTLFPEKSYTGTGYFYSYDSYRYKTVCHATFTAGDDEYVAPANDRYEYYAVGGIITCMAAAAVVMGVKRRRLSTCCKQDSFSEDEGGQTTTNFRQMGGQKADP